MPLLGRWDGLSGLAALGEPWREAGCPAEIVELTSAVGLQLRLRGHLLPHRYRRGVPRSSLLSPLSLGLLAPGTDTVPRGGGPGLSHCWRCLLSEGMTRVPGSSALRTLAEGCPVGPGTREQSSNRHPPLSSVCWGTFHAVAQATPRGPGMMETAGSSPPPLPPGHTDYISQHPLQAGVAM